MERPSPAEYQPALSWRKHGVRLVAMLAISSMTWLWVLEAQAQASVYLVALDVSLGLLGYVLVFFRRRAPLPIAVVLNMFGVFSATVTGPSMLATVSLATRRRWHEFIPVGLLVVACVSLFYVVEPVPDELVWWETLLANILVAIAQIGWGLYIGSRRELIWTLERRAERAEREQALREEQARSGERARIAREMHDVLAHRISQVSMHAGALAFREDLDTEEMRANAAVIQNTATAALVDLRGVLGVLRDEHGDPLDRPVPTYADLPDLLDESAAAGVRVTLREDVVGDVPDLIGRTVYRIVQEGITNVAKHAPGAPLFVDITGSAGVGLTVLLRNPVSLESSNPPPSGLGLIGLSERTHLRGGELTHGRYGGTFWVKGWIPWTV